MSVSFRSILIGLAFAAAQGAVFAHADTCTSSSRGFTTSGYDRASAQNQCHAIRETNDLECDQNTSCESDRWARYVTNSRGFYFYGNEIADVLQQCHLNRYTQNAECDANIVPQRHEDGDHGGWHPGEGEHHGGGGWQPPQEPPRHEDHGGGGWQPPQEPPRHEDHGGGGWHPPQEPPRHEDHGGGGWHPPQEPPRHEEPQRPQPPRQEPPPAPVRSDAQCYLDRYPDICQGSPKNYCKDPAKHYREHGAAEHRIWGCH